MEYDEGVAAMDLTLPPPVGYRQVASVGPMDPVVSDNREQSRFEMRVDDALAGITEYRLHGDHITFTHTEIAEAREGEGLGSRFAQAVLDAAREAGLAVLPACPFVARYIKRHPHGYLDLVPEDKREKYGL